MLFDHKDEHVEADMVLIQANIDDMNPEWSPYVTELLLAEGANDVYWIPIIMKKGRPGFMLNVLASQERLDKLEAIIFRETTTLGLRYLQAACHRLGRKLHTVETPWGEVTVKAGYLKGKLVQFAPEFADCERIAKTEGIPLKQVYETVRRLYVEH